MVRRLSLLLILAAAAAFAASGALADGGQTAITEHDTAVAQMATLHRSDFGSSPALASWSGGPQPTRLPLATPCPGFPFDPNGSDLVVTGAATSRYSFSGATFVSEVQLLKDAPMAVLASRRWAVPKLVACLRSELRASGRGAIRISTVDVPKIGAFTAVYRAFSADGAGNRSMQDSLFVSLGRVRLILITTTQLGPAIEPPARVAAAEKEVERFELVLAKRIVRRGTAG